MNILPNEYPSNEYLGLTSCQSPRKSTLNIQQEDWCWSSKTLAIGCKKLTFEKTLILAKTEGKKEKVAAEDDLCWDTITGSMDMNLSKLQEIVKDRGVWHAAVHRVAKSQTWLSDWTSPQTLSKNENWTRKLPNSFQEANNTLAKTKDNIKWSCSVESDSLRPHGL